jgi:hypothetical protein
MNTTIPAESTKALAFSVIPPLQEKIDIAAVEAIMQSLVLDEDHPVALELAGTTDRRQFIVRATTPTALDHVEALLRARYPQIEIRPLGRHEDPLLLGVHEAVSAVELQAGGASYLPLRTWQETKQEEEQVDPIPALLSALSKLPYATRAVAQLALAPAPDTWAQGHLRKAVEHPLDPERRADQTGRMHDAMMMRYDQAGIATPIVLVLGALVGGYALFYSRLPDWVRKIPPTLFAGQDPHLTTMQILQLVLAAIALPILTIVVFLLFAWIRNFFFPSQLYNMHQVERKTSRMAYRSRLLLYVIGPRTPYDIDAVDSPRRSFQLWQQLRKQRVQDDTRREILLRLIAAYRQFHLASGAYFLPKYLTPRDGQALLAFSQSKSRYGWSKGLRRSRHLLSVDSLAALWHLPSASVLPELALVEHSRTRTLPLPPELVRESAGLPPVGYSEHGGHHLPFALTPHFFTLHTLIAGKSGEGKSTCMEHIAREAMRKGGLVLIDPHGDLCEHVLHLVPSERAEDVVLIDLSDSTASVGINPLDATLGRRRDKAISDLLKTLSHIWVSSWGPRMENAFEMALRTLFEANRLLIAHDAQNGPGQQYTLMDVLPLLTNEHFCHAILQQIDDDYLQRWWHDYYEPLTLMQQRDIINPVITKAAKFESVIARRIIGQSTATINFSQMIAERKIILVKLAKGIIGSDVAAILGATLLGLIQLTLEEQGTLAIHERTRFPIILDEFQVMAGVDYGALAELRKYGATFFLATQSLEYLLKLDQFLLPTVLANVKQLMIFHVSAKDAETLHKELGVEEMDILNLDPHTCYVKMASSTRRQPTFSLRVLPPIEGDPIQAESIRTRCRVRYACSVDVVDAALRDSMLRGIRTPLASASNGDAGRGGRKPPAANRERPRTTNSPQLPEVILLPGASTYYSASPDETPEEAPAEPSQQKKDFPSGRRNNRGPRSLRLSQREYQIEATPLAFSNDFLKGEYPPDEERAPGDMEAL